MYVLNADTKYNVLLLTFISKKEKKKKHMVRVTYQQCALKYFNF